MLTADRIRNCGGALSLFRELGYPIAPVDVDPAEWRRGGVSIPWNGNATLQLVSRVPRFDLFLLRGNVTEDCVSAFLGSYDAYNQLTKSVLIYECEKKLSVFDFGRERGLRRLDVDLAAPTPHAVDRLNLLTAADAASLPRIFDRALDRESVTRTFFQRFRAAVGDVGASLGSSLADEPREQIDAQSLLILSRLLFLSFVQEKGWLNGERRFLVDRLAHEVDRGREFYTRVLAPLFFGCLNTPLEERTLAARNLGRIPYLNGGLFEPSPLERRHAGAIHLPNELLQRVIEDVFEKFDFHPDEGDAAGTHVDPQMLGKVFESLMADDERAASGSFYTPKEIVDVLTERAILHWLGGEPTPEKLARITVLDPACGSGAFLLSALNVLERLWRATTNEPPRDLRRRIVAQSLYGVDLKPEAVRLCELRLWLAIVSTTDDAIEQIPPLPNLDRNILQGNSLLAPADFLGDARADLYHEWVYALHAQRDLLERYRTAPHAQRPALCRIIRGNDQRLACDLLSRAADDAERELQRATAPQRDLFGRAIAVDPELCRELQERVAESRTALQHAEEGTLDFFSYDVHFAPVMAAGGFDVVVGNPPWVRNARIDARAKRKLADRYALFRGSRDGTGFHQPDLSVAFFERALQLTAPDGVTALLMPAKIVNAGYAAPLRQAVRERLVALDDWSDDARRHHWFDADTFPLGIVMSAEAPQSPICVRASGESFFLAHDAIDASGASGEWALVPPDIATILRRLRAQHPPLERALRRRPVMGVKTGDNRNFFLDAQRIQGDRLVTTDGIRVPLAAVCRCVRGRDLQRWSAGASQWMLWPPANGWKTPPRWLENLASQRGMQPEDFRLSFVRPEHVGIKVAWKDLGRGVSAAVLPDVVNVNGQTFPLVPNQTLYSLDCASLDEAYVLAAMLNSTIAGALLVSVAERAKDAHYRYFGRTVAAMPLPPLDAAWDALVRLSRRAHRGADVQEAIDAAAARQYGVTGEELARLREFLARRLGAR
jgi:hypothetical protein